MCISLFLLLLLTQPFCTNSFTAADIQDKH